MKVSKSQEYHIYAHDGRGCYAGGRNFTATSQEDAIAQGKSFPWAFPIPACCTQWVASRDRAHLAAGRRLASGR